ncbi:hypothetical protein [Nocardia sp. NPDC050710]|uniref:hypothetical protein n=1 Tax=Nocardia sp. NPDC050710 TaxID=3157220 RepID=UPI0033DB533C
MRDAALADLLVQQDDERLSSLSEQLQIVRDKIARARTDYKNDLIDGDLYSEIKGESETEIARLDAERLTLSAGSAASAILIAPSPGAAFEGADLAARRAIIDLLCEVRLFSAPRGRKVLDPRTVHITPR